MVDAQTVGVLVTAASVTVAAIYYVVNLRSNNRMRQTQIMIQLNNNMGEYARSLSEFMWKYKFSDYEEWSRKYGPESNLDEWVRQFAFLGFLENLGVLVRRNMLDVGLVEDTIGGFADEYWFKMWPIVREWRKGSGNSTFEIHFEYLVYRMRKYREKVGLPDAYKGLIPTEYVRVLEPVASG